MCRTLSRRFIGLKRGGKALDEKNPEDYEVPIPCTRCSYDVSMTSLVGECPECGFEVWKSYWGFASFHHYLGYPFDELPDELGESIEKATQATGHPGLALWFIQMALEDIRPENHDSETLHHVSAYELCGALFRRFAELGNDSGYQAAVMLDLALPVRIGELVFSMVDAGLIHQSEEDSLEDFELIVPATYWFECRRRHEIYRRLQGGRWSGLSCRWVEFWWWLRDVDRSQAGRQLLQQYKNNVEADIKPLVEAKS